MTERRARQKKSFHHHKTISRVHKRESEKEGEGGEIICSLEGILKYCETKKDKNSLTINSDELNCSMLPPPSSLSLNRKKGESHFAAKRGGGKWVNLRGNY